MGWSTGAAGAFLALAYVVWILAQNHFDPTALLAQGEEAPTQLAYAERMLGRQVVARPNLGHDGKFFFAQANDPWLTTPSVHAAVLDRPTYRSQRVMYPMLAGGFGMLPPAAVVWGLIVVNIGAVGIGSAATAGIARSIGAPSWVGLGFAFNPGVIGELDIDGGGVLALCLGLCGLLALARGSFNLVIAAFSGAVLARETMLLFAAGTVIGFWVAKRVFPWRALVVPAAVAALWRAYATMRLGQLEAFADSTKGLGMGFSRYPFEGIIRAWEFWSVEPSVVIWVSCLIVLMLLFARRALGSRNEVGWSALPFLVLGTMLSVYVWREPYDIARALAPVFTAYPLLLFSSAIRERVFD
jgi:hypothetical protein